jgi:hypothetical protein
MSPCGTRWLPRGKATLLVVTAAIVVMNLVNVPTSRAEGPEPVPDLYRTRTPDSPAFVILGVSPTEIQRPTTPTSLAVALSAFVDDKSEITIPKDLSLEVSPYWLFAHPFLTADKYESSGWRALYRMATLSLGSRTSSREIIDPMGATKEQSVTDLALGGRTRLVDGTTADRKCVQEIEAAAQSLSEAAILTESEEEALRITHGFDTPAYRAALKAAQEKKIDFKPLLALQEKCAGLLSARTGFTLDVAAAAGWRFPDAKATSDTAEFLMAAGWLAAAYTWRNASALALARVARRALKDGDRQSAADGGMRALYAKDRFGCSLEIIYRHRLAGGGAASTYKVAALVEYRIADESWLSVGLGKQFAGAEAGALFTLANLTWGFGEQMVQGPQGPTAD